MASKINVRKGHRAFVTKTIADLETQLRDVEPDEDSIRALQTTLSEKMETLRILDDEILGTLEEEGPIANEIEQSGGIRQKIQKSVYSVDKFFRDKGDTDNKPPHSAGSNSSANVAKLPKLSLPSFSGNPLEFQSFWETFTASVDSNKSLDDILKFTYLKTALKGHASSAIKGLSLTSANYKEAIEILKKRFGNTQLLINSNMEKIMNMDPVTSSNDVKKIRDLFDTIEVHVRNLGSLNVDTSQYGSVLVTVIMAKLPNDIRLLISRKMPSNTQWDIKELMESLKSEIDSREMCQRMSAANTSSYDERADLDDSQMTGAFVVGG